MDIRRPDEVLGITENTVDLRFYRYRYLAEGDSWFSIGEALPFLTSNILLELVNLDRGDDVIVNCASPGETLRRMVDTLSDRNFSTLLDGVQQLRWDGILLSGGGNDLIDACQLPAGDRTHERLLLTPDERIPSPGRGQDYVSEDGWALFVGYLRANLETLIKRRDSGKSHSSGWKAPIFLHTYHRPIVRNAPTGGAGPWLIEALSQTGFAIPEPHRQMVCDELFGRLRDALLGFHSEADRVYVFDSYTKVTLDAADPNSVFTSGDWVNEIHLTGPGYAKVAAGFQDFIDSRMP